MLYLLERPPDMHEVIGEGLQLARADLRQSLLERLQNTV
jgi:hypothetical protein